MPPASASTATTEPATMACRLTLARLASRSRSARSRSRAAVFAAWLFRLLMVVFSVGDAHRTWSCAGYVWGPAGAQPLFGAARAEVRLGLRLGRTRPGTADHAVPGSARGAARARWSYGGRGAARG